MLEKLPYDVRGDLAKDVGSSCTEHPRVASFLQGAYYGLRAPQFSPWGPALSRCTHSDFVTWMEGIVAAPPAQAYDEKYNAILGAYVEVVGITALPTLRAAAGAVANGGPCNAIVEQMEDAAQPAGFGKSMSDADRAQLEEALVGVAREVTAQQASLVADRLYNAGSHAAAISLLPIIYADVISGNGKLLYGVAAIEACDQQAVVHWSAVSEPASRWMILEEVEDAARGFKPRLKCQADGDWPVLATNGPVGGKSDLETWVDEISASWTGKGFEVKGREEKAISLDPR